MNSSEPTRSSCLIPKFMRPLIEVRFQLTIAPWCSVKDSSITKSRSVSTMINSGGALASGVYMNLKTFKGLPPDVQKMLVDLRKEYGVMMAKKQMEDEQKVFNEWKTKHGVELRNLSAADQKISMEAGKSAQEYIFKKQEADGHKDARKVWNYYVAARTKYEDERAKKK